MKRATCTVKEFQHSVKRDLHIVKRAICNVKRFFAFKNFHPPKNGEIALWPSTNRLIPTVLVGSESIRESTRSWTARVRFLHSGADILVLAGSESIFTEVTEYKFISLLQARAELQYKKCPKYCTNGSYS